MLLSTIAYDMIEFTVYLSAAAGAPVPTEALEI